MRITTCAADFGDFEAVKLGDRVNRASAFAIHKEHEDWSPKFRNNRGVDLRRVENYRNTFCHGHT